MSKLMRELEEAARRRREAENKSAGAETPSGDGPPEPSAATGKRAESAMAEPAMAAALHEPPAGRQSSLLQVAMALALGLGVGFVGGQRLQLSGGAGPSSSAHVSSLRLDADFAGFGRRAATADSRGGRLGAERAAGGR